MVEETKGMLNGIKGLWNGLACLVWNLFPHTRQGWIAVAVSLPFILHVQILIHELGHYAFRKIFGVPIQRMIIGTGSLMFRIKSFEVRWIPTSGSVWPGVYCMDIPVRHKLWIYRGGFLANAVSALWWLHNPAWVLSALLFVWSNTRVTVFREKRTMTDGAWIALLRGGFRLPDGFDPCVEDSGVEGTRED